MEIQHQEVDKKGSFFVEENDERLAEMTYVWAGNDRIIIDHTEVDERLKGRGVGKQLVHAAVNMARAKKINIIPLCPFAKSVFQKEEAIRDVL